MASIRSFSRSFLCRSGRMDFKTGAKASGDIHFLSETFSFSFKRIPVYVVIDIGSTELVGNTPDKVGFASNVYRIVIPKEVW